MTMGAMERQNDDARTPQRGRDHLSRGEIRKDAVQDAVEAAATTVGQVTSIVTGAVRDVARAVGGLATELYEIRDASRRAAADHEAGPAEHPQAVEGRNWSR